MPKDSDVLSHRSYIFEGFNASVTSFYKILESMLAARAIPGTKVSRIVLSEGGLLSSKREYLRIRRGAEVYDVGAACIGNSFVISYWLRRIPRHRAWIKWLVGFFLLLPFVQYVSESLNQKITSCCAVALLPFFFIVPMLWMLRLIPGAGLFFKLGRMLFGWAFRMARLPTLFQSDSEDVFRKTVPAIVEQAIEAVRNSQALLRESVVQESSSVSA